MIVNEPAFFERPMVEQARVLTDTVLFRFATEETRVGNRDFLEVMETAMVEMAAANLRYRLAEREG